MLSRRYTLASIAFSGSILASTGATATAQRTFVASYGNDVNVCSLALPCRGFAAAVAQTNSGGEVIVLDSAGYGAVTITKSVTIIAPTGIYAGISVASGDGIQVDGAAIVVVLRGLVINGIGAFNGAGIRLVQGTRLHVDRCDISNMSGAGINVRAPSASVYVTDTEMRANDVGITTSVDASGTGIFAERIRIENSATDGINITTPTNLTLRDALIARNANAGINIFISAPPDIKKSRLEIDRLSSTYNGDAGIVLTVQGKPPTIIEGSITNSLLADNGTAGLRVTANLPGLIANAQITLSDSVIRGNVFGIDARFDGPGVLNYLVATRNTIAGNGGLGIIVNGQTFASRGDNAVYGNNGGSAQTSGTISLIGGI